MAHSICPSTSGLVHFLSQCVPDFCSSLCPHAAPAMAAATTRPTMALRPNAFIRCVKDRGHAALHVRSSMALFTCACFIASAHSLPAQCHAQCHTQCHTLCHTLSQIPVWDWPLRIPISSGTMPSC